MAATLLLSLLALADAAGLTVDEVQAALAGKVPTRTEAFTDARGRAAGRGVGAILIERPVADVWATLIRYPERAEYMPRVKSVTVLATEPTRLRVRQEIDATLTTVRYTAWFTLDPAAHVIRWKLDDTARDNSIRAVDGEYHLFELEAARTVLVYRSHVDTGLKISRAIQDYMARRSIPDLLRAIKHRVESGDTWKKR
jgi:uncharacterized membrane protein